METNFKISRCKIPTTCDIVTFERFVYGINKQIVICTELNKNKGQSITNAAEDLVSQYVNNNGLIPGKIIWIERYENSPKELDLVAFKWEFFAHQWVALNPHWTPISDENRKEYGIPISAAKF